MKKIIYTIVAIATFCNSVNAQSQANFPNRGCATMEEDALQRNLHPELGTLNDFENWMQQKITEDKVNGSNQRTNAVYTIPVIIHIIHSGQNVGSGYNISNAQALSQIAAMNRDFRKMNADTASIPQPFKAASADVQINFCAAQVDPNGVQLAVPGIDRVNGNTKGFVLSNLINDYVTNTIKPATIWNPNKYLNLWVVPDFKSNTGFSLLGYATFPPSSTLTGLTGNFGTATTDGVVCWYKSFGTTGNLDASYNKGRTITHETGHWLGLRHIWGDDSCATDYCNDTPPQIASNAGCPAYPLIVANAANHWDGPACSGTAPGSMFMDYMDYSDDACTFMFTNDQKTRIQTTMLHSPLRISQANSAACTAVTLQTLDAFLTNLTSPQTSSCSPSFTPSFTLRNYGTTALVSCNLNYSIDNGTVSTQQWTGSLNSLATAIVTLPSLTATAGVHTLKIYASNPNNGNDLNNSNDTLKKSFTIAATTGAIVVSSSAGSFSQGFDTNPFPHAGWSLIDPNNNAKWSRTTAVSGFGGSAACARMDNFSGANITGQIDDLVTPYFDFSSVENYYLNFDVAYASAGNGYLDTLLVMQTTDCASWKRIYAKAQTTLATNGGALLQTIFVPTAAQWRKESINVSTLNGNSAVKFKFENVSGYGQVIYIDNVTISNAPLGGVETKSNDLNLLIYPNPSNGVFTLNTSLKQSSDLTIRVFNLIGKEVFSATKPNTLGGSYQIDLAAQSKGIYFIEIKTNNQSITKKISITE